LYFYCIKMQTLVQCNVIDKDASFSDPSLRGISCPNCGILDIREDVHVLFRAIFLQNYKYL